LPINYQKPITETIRRRFSCRTYLDKPIDAALRQRLEQAMAPPLFGPLGSSARFMLTASDEQDRRALQNLGTYGFIHDPAGFIIGALPSSTKNLEDFGYLLEKLVLFATEIGLGTCWLGGSFTRSSFSLKITASGDEQIPAVISIGYIADPEKARRGIIRQRAKADSRLPWEELFFHRQFGNPLSTTDAGAYAAPLNMVQAAPSASNKQPWRILKSGNSWHFFLKRTPKYPHSFFVRLLQLSDLQRVDLGIAMCHFELSAREAGLKGRWIVLDPKATIQDNLVEYSATWEVIT
jgi:hypothetical protein